MNTMTLEEWERAAAVAGRDPFFVGWALAQECAATGKSLADLAWELDTDRRGLARLALCRRPVELPEIEGNVCRIATFGRCRMDALEALLRRHACV